MSQGVEIRVGLGSCGVANGARPVWEALAAEAAAAGEESALKAVGCGGGFAAGWVTALLQQGGNRVGLVPAVFQEQPAAGFQPRRGAGCRPSISTRSSAATPMAGADPGELVAAFSGVARRSAKGAVQPLDSPTPNILTKSSRGYRTVKGSFGDRPAER